MTCIFKTTYSSYWIWDGVISSSTPLECWVSLDKTSKRFYTRTEATKKYQSLMLRKATDIVHYKLPVHILWLFWSLTACFKRFRLQIVPQFLGHILKSSKFLKCIDVTFSTEEHGSEFFLVSSTSSPFFFFFFLRINLCKLCPYFALSELFWIACVVNKSCVNKLRKFRALSKWSKTRGDLFNPNSRIGKLTMEKTLVI